MLDVAVSNIRADRKTHDKLKEALLVLEKLAPKEDTAKSST